MEALLTALGTATMMTDWLNKLLVDATFLRDDLAKAIAIADPAARADKCAPILDKLEALAAELSQDDK